MKLIKRIIDEAYDQHSAFEVLDAVLVLGKITGEQYQLGRKLIRKEFG
jgi:hypothetical protein